MSHDLATPRYQRVQQLYKWELYKVNNNLTKYGGNKHCFVRDIMVLVCHVALQDKVIKVLYGFMVRSPSRYLTILPRLLAIATEIVEV